MEYILTTLTTLLSTLYKLLWIMQGIGNASRKLLCIHFLIALITRKPATVLNSARVDKITMWLSILANKIAGPLSLHNTQLLN